MFWSQIKQIWVIFTHFEAVELCETKLQVGENLNYLGYINSLRINIWKTAGH